MRFILILVLSFLFVSCDVLKLGSGSPAIASRFIFYNQSTAFSSSGSAEAAIDTSKQPLVSGPSAFTNWTNYERGLNGIIIDFQNIGSSITASDFLKTVEFATWNGIAVEGFVPLTAIPTLELLHGQGANYSTRLKIVFADGAIKNTWLKVTVKADEVAQLKTADIFYFGHVLAAVNVGDTLTRIRVNASDVSRLRENFAQGVAVTNEFDLNRDGNVDDTDVTFCRANQQIAGIVAPISL